MVRRILLIKPPETARLNFGAFSLGVLAAAARDLADVAILDATASSLDKVSQAVRRNQPELIGVTVMGMTSVAPTAALIRALRAECDLRAADGRRPVLLAGGHGASMLPEALLEAGADAVVVGEGEETLRQIVRDGVQPGMPGLACRVDGRMVIGPPRTPLLPLDQLAPPARDLMPPPRDGVHLMETSRGCPHHCAFCETTRFYGRQWRPLTPMRVADEVRRLVDEYDAWMIHFADDNFAASPRRVLEICTLLRHGPLPACIVASARADDLLDARVIPALAAAHITRLTIGVESPEPELAAAVGKPFAPDLYRRVFARLRAHGIFSVASFIVGLPGETPEMRARMVERAIAIGPDSARFVPFHPQPGTPLASESETFLPHPKDERDAQSFSEAFYRDPGIRNPLEQAAEAGGIRGLLAKAVLTRHGDRNFFVDG